MLVQGRAKEPFRGAKIMATEGVNIYDISRKTISMLVPLVPELDRSRRQWKQVPSVYNSSF